jgi:hypothetical protein
VTLLDVAIGATPFTELVRPVYESFVARPSGSTADYSKESKGESAAPRP